MKNNSVFLPVVHFISKSEFIIAKNRNGSTKTIPLTFERIYSNFCNYIDAGNQTPED